MHTCNQDTMSHRQALISSGSLQPNLQGMQDVISILRQNPLFPTKELRPFLEKYCPFYKPADCIYIRNFRKRVTKYIMEHDEDAIPTMDDIRNITSNKEINAANELIIEDNTLSRLNLKEIL